MNYSQLLQAMQQAILQGDAAAGEQLFSPCEGRSGRDQMAVYIRNHRYALLQALRSHYPLSRTALGGEEFDQLARNHVLTVRSSHYNIERYAMGFGSTAPQQASPAWPLLRFEAAVLESLLAQEAALYVPENELERLNPHPALRLLDLPLDVLALRQGRQAREPQPLAISRPLHQLRFTPLEQVEYRLLSALVEGKQMAEALAEQPPESLPQASRWFARWLEEGFFAA